VSRSWREGPGGPSLPKYTRSKFKYVPEEIEVPVTQVFIIVNEWVDLNGDTSSEVVGGKWYDGEDAAWDALDEIAVKNGVELEDDATAVQVDTPTLESDEYRIEELTRG